jgi:hypothetical protein
MVVIIPCNNIKGLFESALAPDLSPFPLTRSHPTDTPSKDLVKLY